MINFSSVHVIIFIAIAAFGVITNSFSLWRVFKSFDLNKLILKLVVFDNIVTLTFNCTVLIIYTFFLDSDALTCGIISLTFFPHWLGTASMAAIAAIRYFGLRKALRNQQLSEKLVLTLAFGFICAVAALAVALVWVHMHNGLSFTSVFEFCTKGRLAEEIPWTSTVLLMLPPLTTLSLTVAFDLLIVRVLRRNIFPDTTISYHNSIEEKANALLVVPVRATALSFAILAANMSIRLVAYDVPMVTTKPILSRATILVVACGMVHALRCPLAVLLTFAHQNRLQEEHQRLSQREVRRQMEINHAIKLKSLRRSEVLEGGDRSTSSKPSTHSTSIVINNNSNTTH